MSNPYARIANPVNTPQSAPLPGRETEMVENNAGGYTFTLDRWSVLDRFLILGSEGGTYYATERKLTLDNLTNLRACIDEDGPRTVARILEIDAANRAPKMPPILFALAACHALGGASTKAAVAAALPRVIRTGTHLFLYLDDLKALGSKLGRTKRTALSAWLNSKASDDLGYQMMKYANREGWTWRDALRVIHPRPVGLAHRALFRLAARGVDALTAPQLESLPEIVRSAQKAKSETTTEKVLVKLIETKGVTHEMIPTERQTPAVLAALAAHMPATALIRQLARLTAAGILDPLSALGGTVATRLSDAEWLRKSRIHPIQVLSALVVYRSGEGVRGNLRWTPNPRILEALEAAFYASFAHVNPTGKRILIALDVSGSMGVGRIAGVPGLTPAMASTCLAMVTARTERDYWVMGFGDRFRDLNILATDSLGDAMSKTSGQTFGHTDCAVPAMYALTCGLSVDAIVILTDNQTWAGRIHPSAALRQYRAASCLSTRQVVVGMTATQFTIADPKDVLSLDMVGFDSAAPAILADFIRG